MGCDIHLYVERRVNGVWESADTWTVDPLWPDERPDVDLDDQYYLHRNYYLFDILANVRNVLNVAPIAEPKGLPSDISDPVRRVSDEPDWHSHSWLTLTEIFEYDWTIKVPNDGLLSAVDFALWMWGFPDKSRPPRRYQRVNPFTLKEPIQRIDEVEMAVCLKQLNPDYPQWESGRALEEVITTHFADYYVICEWHDPLYDLTPEFWSETIPRLLRLGKPEDVRIVFWFDN